MNHELQTDEILLLVSIVERQRVVHAVQEFNMFIHEEQ